MCEITVQLITKTNTSTVYVDHTIEVVSTEDFLYELQSLVGNRQLVLIHRDDVKTLAFEISKDSVQSYFEIYSNLKCSIRAVFDVQKLAFNPRTFAYLPKNKCFILKEKSMF